MTEIAAQGAAEAVKMRGRPSTPKQCTKIAQLCMANRIKEPLEEQAMTVGSAGRLIRHLVAELRLKGDKR